MATACNLSMNPIGNGGGVLAVVVLIVHRISRHMQPEKELKPADRLAMQVQIGMALVSGLFGVANLFLGALIG